MSLSTMLPSDRKWPLFEFAYCKDFEGMLDELAELAAEEDWHFKNPTPEQQQYKHPILYNYIHHTFKRLKEEYDSLTDPAAKQSKIAIVGDKACFNTGLYTSNYEQIFGYFTRNRNVNMQPWYMMGFVRESDLELNDFVPLPGRAEYFRDISELVFDYRLEIRINTDHILNNPNNVARLPQMFQDPSNRELLMNVFSGAVSVAKKKVAANYRLAIPQYYEGRVQLLLPLCLESSTPDAALVIYKEGSIYRGRTCLTIDMAYNNARLIAKPESDWLKP